MTYLTLTRKKKRRRLPHPEIHVSMRFGGITVSDPAKARDLLVDIYLDVPADRIQSLQSMEAAMEALIAQGDFGSLTTEDGETDP